MTLEQDTSAYLIEYGKRQGDLEWLENARMRKCCLCGKHFDMGRGWTNGEKYLCNACYEEFDRITNVEEEPEL